MTLARLVFVCFVLAAAPAHASSVTVVATGDADLQATLSQHVEGWLRKHGHGLAAPLAPESVSTLLNCMVMEDQGCARGVVDAQAQGEALLFAQAMKSRTSDATVLIVYWFPKGKEPIGMRRACDECTPDLMRSTVEEMLGIVLGASKLARGRLALSSKPAGLTVLLDNEQVGVTPLEREVPAGSHTIVLMHRGQRVGEKTVKITADVTAEISVPVTLPDDDVDAGSRHRRSPLVGGLVMGLGGAALAAGVALYLTSETDTGEKLYYRDTRPLGIGFIAGGAVVTGVGVWLWLRARGGSEDSTPVVSFTGDAGVIGWTRAF